MALNDTIDISSSDSDFDMDDERDTNQSPSLRTLPLSLSGSRTNSNSRGYSSELPRKVAYHSHGTYASNGSSLNANSYTQGKVPNRSHYSDDVGPSNQNFARPQAAKSREGDLYQHHSVNPRISNFGNEFEKISSQQALNRTLPSSILPSTSNNELRHSRQAWDTYGVPHHSVGSSSSSTYNRSFGRDPSGMSSGNDVFKHENSESRMLPLSLMQGRPAAAHLATSSDSSYRAGTGEEGGEERLVLEAAIMEAIPDFLSNSEVSKKRQTKGLNQPEAEATLPDGLLSVPLLRHQKIALAWMLQKENRSLHCLGGILADDQGLGKTISMISLIQMQRFMQSKSKSEDSGNRKTVALDIDDDDDNEGVKANVGSANLKAQASVDLNSKKIEPLNIDDDEEGSNGNEHSKSAKAEDSDDIKPIPEVFTATRVFNKRRPDAGTLVVCPASVLRQWARELDDKVSDKAKLSVLIYHGGTRTRDPAELAKFDVVLTTYAIVTNEVPKQPLVDEEDDEKNGERYGLSGEFSNKRKKKTSGVTKNGKKGRKGFHSSAEDYDRGPLARVGWHRVILDEAQTIKNHRTQVARSCCSLRAKRRWCLSGTPIQNTIDDLYSYFRFLRYDPYAVYKSFCNTIKVPISRNSIHGYRKLQIVLRAIMLRRTKGSFIKGEPIITLPPKFIRMSSVLFSSEERAFYTQLESDSRTQFKAYAAAGTLNQNYANILLMLLRLRQACDHPCLVKEYDSDRIGKDSIEMARMLPQDMLKNLLSLLETSLAICPQCGDQPGSEAVVTMCGHVFCYECVAEYLTGDDNICPSPGCKEQLGSDVIFSKSTLRRSLNDDLGGNSTDFQFVDKSIVMDRAYISSKIKALIKILKSNSESDYQDSESRTDGGFDESSHLGKEIADESDSDVHVVKRTTRFSNVPKGPIKTIVFSQWTSMLNLVEDALDQTTIGFRRLDGQMSLAARDKGVKDFNTDPKITVMIMSLKAGNLGLNMVAASHVVLLDLWWNPTTEDQAVDRAHRIGQTRPVTVTRLTIKDTVEDRILALQEEKRKMVAAAFGEDHSGASTKKLTVDDLRYLFKA